MIEQGVPQELFTINVNITPVTTTDPEKIEENYQTKFEQGTYYEMLQIVSISLTDTTNLKDIFAKLNYNIVNELDGSTEPSLF